MNGTISRGRLIMSSAPQGPALVLALLNIFLNDTDRGLECTLSKFADDTKLSGVADMLEGREAIQRDFDKLKSWACVNIMRFYMAECEVLHLGRSNPKCVYRLGEDLLVEKVVGVLVDGNVNMNHQCAPAAWKVNGTLDSIRREVASMDGEVVVPLHPALVRPHLETCVQGWGTQLRERCRAVGEGPEGD